MLETNMEEDASRLHAGPALSLREQATILSRGLKKVIPLCLRRVGSRPAAIFSLD